MRRLTALACFVILVAVLPVRSAEEKKAVNPADAEVRKVVSAIEDNFNRGDAKALAALWKPDGEFIGPAGERIVGREAIEAAYQQFLAANKNCKLRLAVVASRGLSDNVALVDAAADMTPASKKSAGTPRTAILLVRRDGRWQIDSVRESVSNAPAHFHQLKDLAWMAGEWKAEFTSPSKAAVTIHSVCDWTANGSFLIRKFSIERKDAAPLCGTEIIGYDPRARRVRSWVFESDGGFGESEWTHEGNQWVVEYDGVLADGGDIAATHVLTQVDANTMRTESADRTVNGERRPDSDAITFHRCPPPEKKTTPEEKAKPPRQVLP